MSFSIARPLPSAIMRCAPRTRAGRASRRHLRAVDQAGAGPVMYLPARHQEPTQHSRLSAGLTPRPRAMSPSPRASKWHKPVERAEARLADVASRLSAVLDLQGLGLTALPDQLRSLERCDHVTDILLANNDIGESPAWLEFKLRSLSGETSVCGGDVRSDLPEKAAHLSVTSCNPLRGGHDGDAGHTRDS